MAGGDNAKRLEFRLPGADANPYLAATAILAVCTGALAKICVRPGTIGRIPRRRPIPNQLAWRTGCAFSSGNSATLH